VALIRRGRAEATACAWYCERGRDVHRACDVPDSDGRRSLYDGFNVDDDSDGALRLFEKRGAPRRDPTSDVP